MTEEDRLFVEFCSKGDEVSFNKLYNKTKPWLTLMIYRIIGDSDVTYDILQESWIVLLDNCKKYNPQKGRFNNMLFTIAKNMSLQWKYKLSKIESATGKKESQNDKIFGVDEGNPQSLMESNELSQLIRKVILKLNSEQQDVILQYYFSEFSVAEIAYNLGIPEGTVKTRLARGRENMKKHLPKTVYDINM